MPAAVKFKVIEHKWVPMPDGVRLSARLWIPDGADATPAPVVLEYIPYRKRDVYRDHDDLWGATLAGAGIAYARIDVRGSGDSEGILTDEYTNTEIADGVRCIDWLSKQPWCSGAVGMRGISWGAINTLQIAAEQPQALRAIMPIAGTDNRYTDDAHYVGGLLAQPNMSWGGLFKTVMAGPPDPEVVGDSWHDMWLRRLQATPAIITRWVEHQNFDAYWQRGSVALDYDAITCPAYVVAGWQDAYSNPVGRLLEHLQVPRKGLIGLWGHTYPQFGGAGLDWAVEEVRWWRHWLCGADTGIMAEPMLQVFMPYQCARQCAPSAPAGRWIAESQWPVAKQATRSLWFSDKGLSAQSQAASPRTYAPGAPVGLDSAGWPDVAPGEQSRDDARSLCFDSELLTEDFEVLGYPVVRLHVSSNKPRAAVSVRVTEVDPRGRSWLITFGTLNLVHRYSLSHPEDLEPGESYTVELPLHMVAHRFKAGHRIRVAISDGLWPLTAPVPAELTVTTGLSRLILPVRKMEREAHKLTIPVDKVTQRQTRLAAEVPTELTDSGAYRSTQLTPHAQRDLAAPEMTLSGRQALSAELKADGRARWHCQVLRGWRRGDWHCEVDVSCEVIVDADACRIHETLQASFDDKPVYTQDLRHRVKRWPT